MLLKRTPCLLLIVFFSLTAFSSIAAEEEPPKNILVFSEELENVVDNAWSNLEFPNDPQPPGLYYVELSDLTGTVGCWGSKANPYPDGPDGELLIAWRDDRPMEGNLNSDFRLQYRPTRSAWVELIVIAPQAVIMDTWYPFGLQDAVEFIGQTFITPEEFTDVGLSTPTWTTNDSGCTMSLYSAEGKLRSVGPDSKLAVKWGVIKSLCCIDN